MSKPFKVGVLYGGESGEHEVSLVSSYWVSHYLDTKLYELIPIAVDKDGRFWLNRAEEVKDDTACRMRVKGPSSKEVALPTKSLNTFEVDVVFPVMHGPLYEDGHLQGALTLAGLPFVGSELITCANAMDKIFCKELVQFLRIPVAPWKVVYRSEFTHEHRAEICDHLLKEMALPLIVKPSNLGSSVGINYVGQAKDLAPAIEQAIKFDHKVLVERALPARELEVSLLQDRDDPLAPKATLPGEIVVNKKYQFYSYEAKYEDPEGAQAVIPADISEELQERCRDYAIKIFSAFDGRGMARIDFLLDKTDSTLYFNDFNPIPGFTPISLYPKLWDHAGVDFKSLVSELIELAFVNAEHRKALSRSYTD